MPDFDDEFTPIAAQPQPTAYRRGPHWFALVAAAFTWPLLFVGGLVTTYKVGMAVPDCPTTFGINMFLYDMTRRGDVVETVGTNRSMTFSNGWGDWNTSYDEYRAGSALA